MKEVVMSLDNFIFLQIFIFIVGVLIGIYSWHKLLHY